jgi:hypothetical protein
MSANFDYAGARKSGYSDNEITEHLSSIHKDFDLKAARKAGYSPQEINEHLSSYLSNKKEEEFGEQKSIGKGLYEVQIKSPEELKNMSFEDKRSYAQDLQREQQLRHSREFTKGGLSGATFGLSEKIPGFEQEENAGPAGTVGNLVGTFAPLGIFLKAGGLAARPLVALAESSSIGARALSSLASMFGVGIGGAAYETTDELAHGNIPSVQDVLKHGAEWMALDGALRLIGKGYEFTKSLFTKAEIAKETPLKTLENLIGEMKNEGIDFSSSDKVAEIALERLGTSEAVGKEFTAELPKELSPVIKAPEVEKIAGEKFQPSIEKGDLSAKKITPEQINNIEANSQEIAESFRPQEFNPEKIERDVTERSIHSKLDSLAPKTADELELGENIKKDIEKQFKVAEAEYKPLYDEAKEYAQGELVQPLTTARKGYQILEDLEMIETKPENYSKVQKAVETAMKDAGFTIERGKGGKVSNAVGTQGGVPLPNLIELKKRLYQIADYDVVEKSIKDTIKELGKAVRADVRIGFSGNAQAEKTFAKAEKLYGETAEKFGTDSIYKMRKEGMPEKIASVIDSPSALSDMRKVLSPSQMKQVEREILSNLNAQTYSKAIKDFKQISRQLSPESRAIGEEIIASKSPLGSTAQRRSVKDSILKDLSENIATGERPAATLNLWKTKKGQELIKEATKGLPNQKQLLNFLESQSLADFAKTVLSPSGKIDFKKFNELVKDPAVLENLRLLGGDDAVTFFKNLEKFSKQLEKNINLLEKIPTEFKPSAFGKEQLQRKTAKFSEKQETTPSKIFGKERELQAERIKEKGRKGANEKAPLGEEKLKRTKEINEKRFEDLEKRNVEAEKAKHPISTKLDEIGEKLNFETKAAFHLMGSLGFGLPTYSTAVGSFYLMKFLVRSQRLRNAFIKASQKQISPKTLQNTIFLIDQILAEHHKERNQ